MSILPNSLPKCTRTVVLDLLFMRKYSLTKTQTTVLYYLILLKNWAKSIEDGYYIILSKKIETDLKLHPKTVEATITQLKKLNLIETKRFKMEEWNKNRTYRAIAITELGKEYNLSFYKEKDYQHAKELEKENEEYRVRNSSVEDENLELKSKNSDLELENKSLKMQLEADERLTKTSLEAIEKSKEIEDKYLALEVEIRELKKQINMQNSNKGVSKEETEEDIDKFRKKVTKEFAQSGKPICNGVLNGDNWAINTKFYINSYSRLSIYLADGRAKQITQPKQISKFWDWLFYHQYRVGKLINVKEVANILILLAFLGKRIILNKKPYTIEKLMPVIGGVKVIISNSSGERISLKNGYGGDILDVEKCKESFELYSVIAKE